MRCASATGPALIRPRFLPREALLDRLEAAAVESREEEDDGNVEQDVGPEDAVVAPSVAPVDLQRGGVLVAVGVLAVLALCRARRVVEVAADGGHELAGILGARLSGRRREAAKLCRRAPDGLVVLDERQERLQEVVKGRERVHPRAPKVGHRRRGRQHATECDDEGEECRHQETGKERRRCDGRNHESERDVKDLKEGDEEPDRTCSRDLSREVCAKVPTAEEDCTAADTVRNLDENRAKDKGHV